MKVKTFAEIKKAVLSLKNEKVNIKEVEELVERYKTQDNFNVYTYTNRKNELCGLQVFHFGKMFFYSKDGGNIYKITFPSRKGGREDNNIEVPVNIKVFEYFLSGINTITEKIVNARKKEKLKLKLKTSSIETRTRKWFDENYKDEFYINFQIYGNSVLFEHKNKILNFFLKLDEVGSIIDQGGEKFKIFFDYYKPIMEMKRDSNKNLKLFDALNLKIDFRF